MNALGTLHTELYLSSWGYKTGVLPTPDIKELDPRYVISSKSHKWQILYLSWHRLSAKELMLLNCVLEKTLESPLDCKEIQPLHPKGDQPCVFFGRTDVEAESPILGPPDAKSWLIWKDPDAGKDWRWEEKGMTEDEMVGWHHWLDGRESGWTPGVGDGQGGLACCDSWGRKESDTTERLIWSDLMIVLLEEVEVVI